jgi:outer membrane protein TolC
MTDNTIADLREILAQRLAEATQEYYQVCTAIAQLEQEIAEFEATHRAVFTAHRDLYARLANARHIEDALAQDVSDAQRDADYYAGETA